MMSIQLLGIAESKRFVFWTKRVKWALEEIELDCDIQTVDDLDDFIRYELIGIPALVINGKVVFQKYLPSQRELEKVLTDNYNMMFDKKAVS